MTHDDKPLLPSNAADRDSDAAPVRLGIVVGTTRPGRKAADVAAWAATAAREHGEIEVVVLDPAKFALPLLDEPVAAAFGQYQHAHTRAWAAAVAACDAFVFVTPEYNHSFPAALKNAIDYLYEEWHHKPAAVIGYGLQGGVRAVEALRPVLVEVGAVPMSGQVALSVFEDFSYDDDDDPASAFTVTARAFQDGGLRQLLDQVLAYARVLAPLRAADPAGEVVGRR